MSNTRIVTGEVRFSFVNLLKPRANQYGGEEKFSVTILVPKSDVQTKANIDAAIEAAKQLGKANKWNGVIPPMVAIPVYDGDGVKPSDGTEFGPECKGHWVFSASSKVDQPPKIVDANLQPVIDPTQIYSGMYGKIAINFAPYANAGKKGIGAYISTNVQKTRDGEPLGAAAPDASEDFGGTPQVNVAGQMPYGMQPQHQQPPAQPNYGQAPQYQQPAPNYGQQPQYQQPPQQGYGQAPQQPQIDPITGQPIGSVYGI